MISFYGIKTEDTNVLNWSVAHQINVEKYEIEYSDNGIDWKIAGAITELNFNKLYQFKHDTKTPSVFYRLKIIDFDSQISYSNVIHIFLIKNDKEWKVLTNPATDSFILYGDEYCNGCSIYIRDFFGRLLIHEKFEGKKLEVNTSKLLYGHYYCSLLRENKLTFSCQFVKI